QPKRLMVHIPDIVAELVLPRQGIAAVNLSPAGKARPHLVAAGLLGVVERQILHQQRARADQAHVALEDVPELRQLVEAGRTQKAAERRKALGIGKKLPGGADRIRHGTELDQIERDAPKTGTLLDVENR